MVGFEDWLLLRVRLLVFGLLFRLASDRLGLWL